MLSRFACKQRLVLHTRNVGKKTSGAKEGIPGAPAAWEDRRVVVAVGSANEASARLDAQTVQLHEARDPLVIDEVTAAAQFMGHTAIAVAGKLIRDALDKLNDLKIAQGCGGLAGLAIERAAGQFDYLAPPSD